MWISVIEPKEIGESCIKLIHSSKPLRIVQILRIRSSGKCLSSANMFSTTMHLYTNAKPSLWNVAVFISTGQNAYVIRQNNIKQRRYASIISSQNERNFPDNLIHWPGYGAILSPSNLEMYLHRWGRKNSAKISQIIIQKKKHIVSIHQIFIDALCTQNKRFKIAECTNVQSLCKKRTRGKRKSEMID